jgi:hypothetical protein
MPADTPPARPYAKSAYDEPLAHRIIDDLIRRWVKSHIAIADATSATEELRAGVRHAASHLDEHWVHLVPDIADALRRANLLTSEETTHA